MRVVVFGLEHRVGAIDGGYVIDLQRAYDRLTRGSASGRNELETMPADLGTFIATGPRALEAAQRAVEHALGVGPGNGSSPIIYPTGAVKLHAPWARKRIACAGGNYAAPWYNKKIRLGTPGVTLESEAERIHAAAQWGFWKVLDEVAGPDGDVPYPARSRYFDYEGELVAVIGKRGKNIKADRIAEYVWGVTLGNDWSIRDDKAELPAVRLNLAKNFDRAASLGPCVVVGEVDPHDVDIETRVDGELRQSYNSKDMVFSFGEILEYLSRDFTFVPGDVIFGGTGDGTAVDTTPIDADGSRATDRFLKIGQTVEVWSQRIGSLRNTIVSSEA